MESQEEQMKKRRQKVENNPELKNLIDAILNGTVTGLQLALMDPSLVQRAREYITLSTKWFINACASGNVEMVRTMLQQGHDPNLKTKDGHSAIHAATRNQNWQCLDLLLRCENINPNLENSREITALLSCFEHGQCSQVMDRMAIRLLQHPQTNPNAKDSMSRRTSLHYLCLARRLEGRSKDPIIQTFLSHPKFDPSVRDFNGYYAYQIPMNASLECMELLLPRIRFMEGIRGALMVRRRDLPVLPKEIWREIYKRKYLEELCEEERDHNGEFLLYDSRRELCLFAEKFFNVPESIIKTWLQGSPVKDCYGIVAGTCYTVTTSEIKATLSGLLRLGEKYSENAQERIEKHNQLRRLHAQLFLVRQSLLALDYDLHVLDQQGEMRCKTLDEILQELWNT